MRTAQPILIASGSEVTLIVAAAERLQKDGIPVRYVSMPSWKLFDALPQAERNAVLSPAVRAPRGGGWVDPGLAFIVNVLTEHL